MTPADKPGLGGRLPLLRPDELNASQKQLYDRILEKVIPWSETSGFLGRDEAGFVIGPFNPTLYSPEMWGAFYALQELEQAKTSLTERVRQVAILTVGAVWEAPYELYAHKAVARKAGFASMQIEALAQGHPISGLRDEEHAAQQFVHALVAGHQVGNEEYKAAQEAFGDRGVVELLLLVGCYLTICAVLCACRIPVPAEAAKNTTGA